MTSSGSPSPSDDPPVVTRSPKLGLAELFQAGLDLGAVERMLLALATHPEGCDFARAHLLVWNPDLGCLEGRLAWKPGTSRSLGDTLAGAHRQASEGTDPDATRFGRGLKLDPGELEAELTQAWVTRSTWLGRPRDDPPRPWGTALEVGAVPLEGPHRQFGMIVGEWNSPGDSEVRSSGLESLRVVAGAALKALTTSKAVAAFEERLKSAAALAHAAVSSLNVAEVASRLVRGACVATGARGAALWRMSEADGSGAGALQLASTHGPAGTRERLGRGLGPLASHCVAEGKRLAIERAINAPFLSPDLAAQLASMAAVPLIAYGRTLGALIVYDRAAYHPNDGTAFDEQDLELLAILADQGALAFEQARLEELRLQLERSRHDLLRELGRSERMAALAEMAARAAGEARNPLASIGAFSRRMHRGLSADDPNREYLEVVIREAERVERALTQTFPLDAGDGPRFVMESVNALLQKALQHVGERLVRRRVRLLKRLAPDLPPLLLDPERMGQVLENVLSHVLDRVTPGGRVRVESKRLQQFEVVEIAHDGPLRPGEALAEVFVPFTLSGEGAADVGLSLARQVVREHGGEVRARSEGEWSMVFSLSLPIRGNEDRRKSGTDRRVTRNDRRQRAPAG